MLDFLEFIALLFQILKWILIGLFLFWVLPAMTVLLHDEPITRKSVKVKVEPYQGRHWRDPQDYKKKMYIIAFVNRYREDRGGVLSHRRISHE